MHSEDSTLSTGTIGSPQTSMEQSEYSNVAGASENDANNRHKEYIAKELPKASPIHIPSTAKIKEDLKNQYEQVKYTWTRGEYKYTSRWHTRTPNAPLDQGDTWVVERRRKGIASGPNARKARTEILIGKKGNQLKWIPKWKWQDAIRAHKNGTATKEQEELLKNGHWKA